MDSIALALMFVAATNQFNLPKGLLSAVCFTESTHRVYALNKDDGKGGASLGICQVKLPTARMIGFRGGEFFLMHPKVNTYYAAKYLAQQLHRYKGDTIKAVAAYNTGTYKETKPGFPVNQPYINKVFNAWVKKK